MIIKEIIRKWEKRYDSLYHSGMSETDNPRFCLNIIKKVIQDLRVHEQEIFWDNWSKHARKGQNKERRANKMNKQLTDNQLKLVLPSIDNKKMNFEKDNFRAGYIQAMLNYGIISGKQYEKILEKEAIAPFHILTGQ